MVKNKLALIMNGVFQGKQRISDVKTNQMKGRARMGSLRKKEKEARSNINKRGLNGDHYFQPLLRL